ncbi:efflux RND transporter periplasmic adaptor subunit [Verrucomicrobium sp. BvORR106]|uniref:efflux RND transporter periplasmic adaptor subunit n=1 Tax=Verrucomicrobium sp. BvORR106 TaxID=1403819 RepID=UPI0005713F02|nr:efflux RND transporter periplasmic adaptor subunit [Verrucomicrobium sp. BvORR106]
MKKTRWFLFLLVLVAAGAAVIWRARASGPGAGAGAGQVGGRPSGPQTVAVLVAQAESRDVPVWLTGIGSVQAFNTVTVRPRVGGSLDQVNFTEGATVKQGDVLAQIDPRPYRSVLSQAQAKKAQDEAQLTNAKLELTRVQSLVKNNAVSQQVLDQAQASMAQLTALVQADQAAVESAQLDLDFTTVRAPIAGRTGVRLVDAGNVVTANQGGGIVVVTQLKPISLVFTLPQQNLPFLRRHMQPGAAPLVAQALDDDGTVLDEGRLELIDNQIDSNTGTLKLKATFANEKLALWPGQFVSARVLVETHKNAIVVPAESIQPGLDGPFTYVVKADSTVEARTLKTGLTFEGATLVEDGLSAGEKVVREGQSKLKPGAQVAPQQDKMQNVPAPAGNHGASEIRTAKAGPVS